MAVKPAAVEHAAARPADGEPEPSTDPEELAADIERTRDDLAETLDAIAEKVSPKRVAGRVGHQISETARHPRALLDKRALGVGALAFLASLLVLRRRRRRSSGED
ncbi:MAG TPA: DUF3618 domain-containing protein [Mycobacteriales bacterium]|nr:DUF3618 domain-containing protein [Mycobacteriales bacterium]